ncbi:MAG TPA: inositol monophosphatase family protein [Acidimicrobiales bacterium]|nr:inositol monophosphatase family protein [Acidimicrobiales bacterium]
MTPGDADADDLRLALELVDVADAMTTAAFRRPDLVVEAKPDLTPVTEADRGVEEAVRARLEATRPGDAVMGEEYGASGGPGGDGSGRRRWIIDPIDGTKNFVRGIPVWATLLALEVDGALVVGVASAPALGRRWWAGRGLGAYAGAPGEAGVPIAVSAVAELGDAQVSYSGTADWAARGRLDGLVALERRCWRGRGFGDFWSHVLVAEGSTEIGLDPVVSLWDLAALQVIVEEAGGRFTDLAGAPRPDGGSAISTNGLLHDEALRVLMGRGPGPGAGPAGGYG